jgi:hypothetical protein
MDTAWVDWFRSEDEWVEWCRRREGFLRRQQEIWALWNEGLTFREIGARFGITGERARQIWVRKRRRALHLLA